MATFAMNLTYQDFHSKPLLTIALCEIEYIIVRSINSSNHIFPHSGFTSPDDTVELMVMNTIKL